MLYKVVNSFARKSQDIHTNVFGQQLIELCSMCECLILNGLSEYGFDDSCTFVSKSGLNVVDYFFVSCDMFSSVCITTLEVENMIESDHFPVVMTINVAQILTLTVDDSKIVQVNGQTIFIEKSI